MLKVKDKFKGVTATILGIGCIDFDSLTQPMLKVLEEKYPNKFTENAKPEKEPKSRKGKGSI